MPGWATSGRSWSPNIRLSKPSKTALAVSVNLEISSPDVQLEDADEVAFLPPVSGGAGNCSLSHGPIDVGRVEADDALATGATIFGRQPGVEQLRICSPDKDLAQCVEGSRIVCVDRRRGLVFDEPAVVEKFGVSPASIPDWLALVGDSADGIPGIPRWGARSTATVLGEYGKLEQIPDDPATWSIKVRGAATLARNLVAGREEARLYRELATLRRDVPLGESLAGLEWRGARPGLAELCFRLGDAGLPERARERLGRGEAPE